MLVLVKPLKRKWDRMEEGPWDVAMLDKMSPNCVWLVMVFFTLTSALVVPTTDRKRSRDYHQDNTATAKICSRLTYVVGHSLSF